MYEHNGILCKYILFKNKIKENLKAIENGARDINV